MSESHGSEPDFDVGQLREYLSALPLGLQPSGTLEIQCTEGGMSNPTYFLRDGDWHAVLRKRPRGRILPSAHAIDREYRVLEALQSTDVPVPNVIHFCEDAEVIGTTFYLMERLEGRVFHQFATPGLDPATRHELYESMIRALASIHNLDPNVIGLGDYGRPGNYFERQLKRWSEQWVKFRRGDNDNPALDKIILWLSENVPQSDAIALCHGDFRIGNVMFHPTEAKVVGVLDWELSTLGHPLVDLAFNSQAWHMAPDENGGLLGLPLAQLGIPQEFDYLERYYELAGSKERMTNFHRVFAMFRGAVGSAGVAMRGEAGNSTLADSARVGRHLAQAYAVRGLAMIDD